MDLYDNPFSPYAFKVRAALYEKGIAHEKREIRTHADRELLLRVNPRGEVPRSSTTARCCATRR
jgi:glutathione S-transferase